MIRTLFGMCLTAAILTFGPDWTVRLIFEAQKAVLTKLHGQLENGMFLKKLSNDLTGTKSEWLLGPQENQSK